MIAVMETWPLLLTAVLICAVSGCVMWTLDMWFNPQEFPNTFPRGPFEGFWWAFTSMSTVGFGDKVPKSTSARLFAVVWILIGITVFSLFTAVLTSALNVPKVLFLHEDFRGMRLGSLNFTTAGEEALLKERAKYRAFGDVFAMAEALKKHEIPGFAIDKTMLDYYLVDFEKQAPGIKKIKTTS